jgi:hypothetical protein
MIDVMSYCVCFENNPSFIRRYQRRRRSPQRRRQFPGERRSLGQYFLRFWAVFGPFLRPFSKADESGFPIFKNPTTRGQKW